MKELEERVKRIRLFLFDVDGVLTDGRIIYDDNGNELKAFDVKDGHGIKLLMRGGIKVGIITSRYSKVVAKRAEELGIGIIHQRAIDKLSVFRRIKEEEGLRTEEVAFMGDDLVDLPVLREVGFSVAPSDAVEDVKGVVHYVTRNPGGRGAVREVCELILKLKDKWKEVAERYY